MGTASSRIRLWGLKLQAQDLGFGVSGLGWGSELRDLGLGFRGAGVSPTEYCCYYYYYWCYLYTFDGTGTSRKTQSPLGSPPSSRLLRRRLRCLRSGLWRLLEELAGLFGHRDSRALRVRVWVFRTGPKGVECLRPKCFKPKFWNFWRFAVWDFGAWSLVYAWAFSGCVHHH